MESSTSTGAWWMIGLIVTVLIAPSWLAWWNSRVNKQELRANGGSSFRDAFDEHVREQRAHNALMVARMDEGARMIGNHSDRLAVLEGKPCPHDPNLHYPVSRSA